MDINGFLNSFTDSKFQGAQCHIHSHFSQNKEFSNYVPEEFEKLMDDTVAEWEQMGVLLEWEKVRKVGNPHITAVVSPWEWSPLSQELFGIGDTSTSFVETFPFLWIMLQK